MPLRSRLLALLLLLTAAGAAPAALAQIPKQRHIDDIKAQSVAWNRAFNGRDSTALYALLSSRVNLCEADACYPTPADARRLLRTRWRSRPDLNWMNRTLQVQVNDQVLVGYETGEFTESWTPKAGAGKSQQTGRYWLMWGFENGSWRILSGIFTPLTCTGCR
ncbi:hypothetical protein [Hymenobacter sp. B81]|uniref:hypothetical protein n=1 Tax=Hymenobacter sp. B81 TaxID=3344878 RepID=UPI0037DC5068